MALVVLLRGLNVGGHRRLRPSVLAARLAHLDVVNIGAAGTLVVRRPVSRTTLRAAIARQLPFDAAIMICDGRDILQLLARDHFAGVAWRTNVVRFVSLLARRPRVVPTMPRSLPSRGRWLLRLLATDGRFVVGQYRRHMKVIGYLGLLDGIFGTAATTRSWSTLAAIARILGETPRA